LWIRPGIIVVLDEVEGPGGEHLLEQFWHPSDDWLLVLPEDADVERSTGGEFGWKSDALGRREEARVICVRRRATLPARMAAVIDLTGGVTGVVHDGGLVVGARRAGVSLEVRFREEGAAEWGCAGASQLG
jgi:hypothetical protein